MIYSVVPPSLSYTLYTPTQCTPSHSLASPPYTYSIPSHPPSSIQSISPLLPNHHTPTPHPHPLSLVTHATLSFNLFFIMGSSDKWAFFYFVHWFLCPYSVSFVSEKKKNLPTCVAASSSQITSQNPEWRHCRHCGCYLCLSS